MRNLLLLSFLSITLAARTATVRERAMESPGGGPANGTIAITAPTPCAAADGARVETISKTVSVSKGAFSVAWLPSGDMAQSASGNSTPMPLPGGGASVQSLGAKVAERISVKDFGAKGDGRTNDTAAIQSAITAAAGVVGGTTLFIPPGKYMTTAPLIVPANTSNLTIEANADAEIYVNIPPGGPIQGLTGFLLDSNFPDSDKGTNPHMYLDAFPTPVALNLAPLGSTSFTCTTSCGTLNVGDWVALVEGNGVKHDAFRHYAKVLAASGTTFTVDTPLDWSPGVTNTNSFGFARITWSVGVKFRGFTIYCANGTAMPILGSVQGFTAEDMTFDGDSVAGWAVSGDSIAIHHNVWKRGMYAYSVYSTRVSVTDNRFVNIGGNGAAFELGQGNAHVAIAHNAFTNWTSSGTYLIGGGGRDVSITDNQIEAMAAQNISIKVGPGSQQWVIANNTIRALNQACFTVMGDRTLPAWAQTFDISVMGNTCDNAKTGPAIYYGKYPDVQNLRSIGNDFTNTQGEGVYGGIDAMDKHTWTILGNVANRSPDATQQLMDGTTQLAGVLPSRRIFGTTAIQNGDSYFSPYGAANGWLGEYWEYAGTLGALSGVTGSTTVGSNQLAVNTTNGLQAGMCVTIAGIGGSHCIGAVDYGNNRVTLVADVGTAVSNAAIGYAPPGGMVPLWPADERAYQDISGATRTLPQNVKFLEQAAAGTANLTLPSSTSARPGKEYVFTNGAGSMTINAAPGDTILGQVSLTLGKPGQSVRVSSDGVHKWNVIGFVDPDLFGTAIMSNVPSSTTTPCTPPRVAYDANYAYFCVAANTWKRTAIATW